MSTIRMIVAAGHRGRRCPAGSRPGCRPRFGQNRPSLNKKWEFAGKDNTGLVWSGILGIEKLDPTRFDPNQYHSLYSLEVRSRDPSKGTKGVEAPCEWNPGTRTVTFGNTYPAANVYAAVLSAGGKVLTQDKWSESKIVRGEVGGVARSSEWSAKLSAR